MEVDDYSFKKPGAIPFKWEIRPGVPKLQESQKHQEHASSGQQQQQQKQPLEEDDEFSFPETPRKLAPPPAGYCFQPPIQSRTRSFRSAPRSRSGSFRFNYSSNLNLAQPVSVSSNGCFPSPLLIKKSEKYKTKKPKSKAELEPEMDSASDLETLSRWSISSWKSVSPFRESPLSSSLSSYPLTPPRRLVNDAEWAGFGLF